MNRGAGFPAQRKEIRFCLFLLAAIVLAPPLALGGVNRWTTEGLSGVFIASLAVDPTNADTVYAGTYNGGIFQSRDGGSSWTSSLSVSAGVQASGLAIDPSSPSTVYAATAGGIFRSVNAGGNWAAVGPQAVGARGAAYSVGIDPVAPATVYAGTAEGVFQSDDRGASWNGSHLAAAIYSLAFSRQSPSTIFGADYQASYYYYSSPTSSLYKSTDRGATWKSSSPGFSVWPGTLAVDPTNPSVLYAGGDSGLSKSEDSGSTWRLVFSGTVRALVMDPRNPLTLYAGTIFAVFRSMDGGVTWHVFGGPIDLFAISLAIDQTGTRLYAGTPNGVFSYQIVPGSVGPVDLSVGTDNKTRVLYAESDKMAFFRRFDTSGNSTIDGPYGPYAGWIASSAADGPDGQTRLLWTNPDGSAGLWLLGPTGIQASYRYGPAAGWTALDVSVARNGTTHLLWTQDDARIGLLSVGISGAVVNRATYGPFYGWQARSIADGADGLTRLLWNKFDGSVGLSLLETGSIAATYRFSSSLGWTAQDVTVASDTQTRILMVNDDGRMALWSVNNSGAVTKSGPVYAPPASGQVAARISAGADGLTRVLWTSPEGNGTLWLLDLDNVRQASFDLGPTTALVALTTDR